MLQVARKKAFCKVLGPGTRSVIWFHGCPRRCLGCIADTMNETVEFETVSPPQLADWVKGNTDIEGITLSGGDPFFQPPNELTEFLALVKEKKDLSVLCYTGYTLEELQNDDGKQQVLLCIDILIDGQYIQEQDEGQRWRGSGNQRFHFLTERYRSEAAEWYAAKERQVEIELDLNGKLLISGVPSSDFIAKLTKELQRREINIDFS
ncbi:anaerobic ribonucleoside-triphosphate reductase activating protein [Planctomycetales bacterium]|nr:anaerobic ribonucleoside-triphosphate reductase activating protein [Planctomycetales bacterium]